MDKNLGIHFKDGPSYTSYLEARVKFLERALLGPESMCLPEGVELTQMQARLIGALVAGQGEPITVQRIHAAVYGDDAARAASQQTIRVMLSTLRKTFGDRIAIRNRVGFGYYLDAHTLDRLSGKEPWDE